MNGNSRLRFLPAATVRQVLLVWLGTIVLRLVGGTVRWDYSAINDARESNPIGSDPRIFAFWHGQQLFMPWLYMYLSNRVASDAKSLYVLASRHRDGQLIARVLRRFGIKSVAGSSTTGGREALFALLARLKDGSHVAITPDGPKGPNEILKPGVLKLAQKSGTAVTPVAVAFAAAWSLKSWDRMLVPKPFTKGVFVIGDPISVPRSLNRKDFESLHVLLQNQLQYIKKEALRRVNIGSIDQSRSLTANQSSGMGW